MNFDDLKGIFANVGFDLIIDLKCDTCKHNFACAVHDNESKYCKFESIDK